MQKNTYNYEKEDLGISIGKLPVWFVEKELSGTKDNGLITFQTQNQYDDTWGPLATIEISWEKKDRTETFHAKEVQNSIDIYNSIKLVITNKENIWVRSHEFTYWFGARTKMIRKGFYPEMAIHGIFYCEVTERLFNIHAVVIREHYEGFKPYIIEMFDTILCH